MHPCLQPPIGLRVSSAHSIPRSPVVGLNCTTITSHFFHLRLFAGIRLFVVGKQAGLVVGSCAPRPRPVLIEIRSLLNAFHVSSANASTPAPEITTVASQASATFCGRPFHGIRRPSAKEPS